MVTEISQFLTPEWWSINVVNNEFFWAAIGAGLLVAVRSIPIRIWRFITYRTSFEISFYSEHHDLFQAAAKWAMINTMDIWSNRSLIQDPDNDGTAAGYIDSTTNEWIRTPSTDVSHFNFWNYLPVIMRRSEREGSTNYRSETIDIQVFTLRKEKTREKLIDEIMSFVKNDINGKIAIHNYINYDKSTIYRDAVDPNTLVYPNGFYEDILDDIKSFLDSKSLYNKKGIHWHRGYGFFGPPGTGKTSMITALASELDLPIHKYRLSEMTPINFISSINRVKEGFIVIEDADKFDALKDTESDSTNKLDLHALLQIMDGLDTPDGAIFILTSNHPENIESSLLRPGRISKAVNFEYLKGDDIYRFLDIHYDNVSRDVDLSDIAIAPSKLQNLCLKNDFAETTIHEIVKEQ